MSQNEINNNPERRVYKYRLYLDSNDLTKEKEAAINDELYLANALRNRLVEINQENWVDYYELRKNASTECAELCKQIEALDEELYGDEGLFKKTLKEARNTANSRNKNHPLLVPVYDQIKICEKKRDNLRAQLKKTADPLISKDEKTRLNDEFKQKVNSAVQRENSGMYGNSETADWIKRFDFLVSRQQAFAGVRGWPKKHRFDGSGYWIFRFGRNGSGKKWKELFKPATASRFTLLGEASGQIKGQNRGLRHIVRGTVILSGEAKKKAYREKNKIGFSIIMQRPIPEDAIIRNAQIVKQRSGKDFQYYV